MVRVAAKRYMVVALAPVARQAQGRFVPTRGGVHVSNHPIHVPPMWYRYHRIHSECSFGVFSMSVCMCYSDSLKTQ